MRSEGHVGSESRGRRFLKYFVHGFALSILVWASLNALSFVIILPFQFMTGSTYLPITFWAIILVVSIIVGFVIIGAVNSLLTNALWLPTKLSIRKSIVDGLAFSITSSLIGLAYPLLLVPIFFLQYFVVLFPYYLGLPSSIEFVLLISSLYLVLFAPLYGKIGKDIALDRLEFRSTPPCQAKEKIMDVVNPAPHSELIATDNSRPACIGVAAAQARREKKER